MRVDETPTQVVTKEDTIDEGYENTPPEENTDSPSWADATEEQRSSHLGNMVVECIRGIGQNNPVMWVWAPTGLGAEIGLLWRQAMDEALAEHPVSEESPMRRMYYPEVREHDKCRIPNNLTLPHRGEARQPPSSVYGTCCSSGEKRGILHVSPRFRPETDSLRPPNFRGKAPWRGRRGRGRVWVRAFVSSAQ